MVMLIISRYARLRRPGIQVDKPALLALHQVEYPLILKLKVAGAKKQSSFQRATEIA